MKRCAVFALVGMALLGGIVAAQEPSRGPDGGASTHVSGVEVLAIPDKPFSANTSTEWTRALEDGSTVVTQLQAKLARDSRGRVYRENHVFVPANSDQKSPIYEIHIYDPGARAQIRCKTHTLECVMTDYAPMTFFETRPTGSYAKGTRSLARESLGTDVIEGLNVIGTRETITVNAGVLGNAQPIISTRDFWYSEELQTNLAVTRHDPREGTQVIRLSNLSQAEPDAHLFEVPIGYSVRDLRASARRRQY
jgi:hypothetical protein